MVRGQLEQRRALQRGVPAPAERLLEPCADLRVRSGPCRTARPPATSRARSAGSPPCAAAPSAWRCCPRPRGARPGIAVALHRAVRVQLGRGLAAPHRLHVDHQVHQVLDGRLVLLEAHRVGARQREPQRELGLGEPGVELVPEAPPPAIGSRRRLSVKNTRSHGTSTSSSHSCPSSSSKRLLSGARNGFPWRAETLRQTTVTPGALTGTMKVARWPSRSTSECAADVDVLRVRRARVHADLAAQHEPGVGLPDHAERGALRRIRRAAGSRWWPRPPRT